MPRDYKNRSRRNEPESDGPSPVVWLFVGILIGLIISGVFYIKGQHRAQLPIPEKAAVAKHQSAKKPAVDQPITPKPQNPNSGQNLQTQFDFYNVLPNKTSANNTVPPAKATPVDQSTSTNDSGSTDTDTSNTNTDSADTATTDTTPAAQKANYIVQIATFAKPDDADQLKAQLVLLGFDVNVTPVHKKNGQTLQRVWLGPFTNKDDASSTQKQLKQNQITSDLLKSTT